MKKCTGDKCPMQMGYDFENCPATEWTAMMEGVVSRPPLKCVIAAAIVSL